MGVSLLQCHTHVTAADLPEGDPEPSCAEIEAATTSLDATKALLSATWNPPPPAAIPHHHLARSFPWQGPFVCRAGPTGGFLQHCGAVAPFGCRRRLGREARGLCSTSSGAWSAPLVRSPSRAFVVPPTLAPLGLFAAAPSRHRPRPAKECPHFAGARVSSCRSALWGRMRPGLRGKDWGGISWASLLLIPASCGGRLPGGTAGNSPAFPDSSSPACHNGAIPPRPRPGATACETQRETGVNAGRLRNSRWPAAVGRCCARPPTAVATGNRCAASLRDRLAGGQLVASPTAAGTAASAATAATVRLHQLLGRSPLRQRVAVAVRRGK